MFAFSKKFWRKTTSQIAVTFCLVILVGLFFFWGSQLVLDTDTPFIEVSTGSMSISSGSIANSWIHPFEQTLQMGDFLIVQGVDPANLNTNYPNSDIIVFHNPDNLNIKIIHRIVAEVEINGTLYFFTKGDGSTQYKWPAPVDPSYFDQWRSSSSHILQGAVSEKLVEGKVIMRVPWVGYITLLLQNLFGNSGSGDPATIIVSLIILMMPLLVILKLLNFKRKQ